MILPPILRIYLDHVNKSTLSVSLCYSGLDSHTMTRQATRTENCGPPQQLRCAGLELSMLLTRT